jgi:hypothetical protein
MCLGITFIGLVLVSVKNNQLLDTVVDLSKSTEAIATSHTFQAYQLISLIIVFISGVGSIAYHWAILSEIKIEMEVFRRVLSKSITTNMMLNTHSFKNPEIARLADNYNSYVKNKMDEYKKFTGMMMDVQHKTYMIDEETRTNKQIFDSIPFPLYTIYIDANHSITWSNLVFDKLIGMKAENLIEPFGLPSEEQSIVIRHSTLCIDRREPMITHECRSYAGSGSVNYHVYRTPVIDMQDVCILVVVMLVSEDYIP